jgi:ferredoxin
MAITWTAIWLVLLCGCFCSGLLGLRFGTKRGVIRTPLPLRAKKDWSPPKETLPEELLFTSTKTESNGTVFSLEMSKRAGISWGSDLSFRWIYVLDLEPTGEAAQTGVIQKGDYIIQLGNTSTIGQDFDFVLSTLNRAEARTSYTFFRGTKDQLIGEDAASALDPSKTTVKVTVQQDGKKDVVLTCPGGTNLRRLLVGNGINVYRSLTRWTNCNGQQRCGTCIVDVTGGLEACSRRDLSEEAVLAENPITYRLSCRTEVYGDVTVKVQTPVGAAQWTR